MNQYEHLAKTGYLLGVYDGGFHLDGLSWKIYEEREATENYNRKKITTVGFEPKPENALKSEGRRLSTRPNSRYRLNVNIIIT